MFQDAQTTLSQSQAFTGNGPNVSTNLQDLGAAAVSNGPTPDPARGRAMCIALSVGVAAKVSGTNETYQFDIIQSTVAAGTSPDILASFPFTNALAATQLAAGDVLILTIPPNQVTKQFLGYQESGTNTPTITCTAFITTMDCVQDFFPYATKIIVL